jgi:hypothetical protein
MMAKDPAERYPTRARADEALQFFLKQEEELQVEVSGQEPITRSSDLAESTGSTLNDTATSTEAGDVESDLIFAAALSSGKANRRFKQRAHAVRRDWLLLVLGGVGVYLPEVIGWLLAHLLHGWP